MRKNEKRNGKALLPIVVFVVLYLGLGILLMWIPLRISLRNGELVYGMSHLRIFMTVSYK